MSQNGFEWKRIEYKDLDEYGARYVIKSYSGNHKIGLALMVDGVRVATIVKASWRRHGKNLYYAYYPDATSGEYRCFEFNRQSDAKEWLIKVLRSKGLI